MPSNRNNDMSGLVDRTIAVRRQLAEEWMKAYLEHPTHAGGAIIYHATGDVSNLGISTVEEFSYEKLSEIVGGGIEQYRLSDGRWMTINADGLGLNLPYNLAATALYMQGRGDFAGIHGDVLVCSAEQVGATG